jgi:hypothetical protein
MALSLWPEETGVIVIHLGNEQRDIDIQTMSGGVGADD